MVGGLKPGVLSEIVVITARRNCRFVRMGIVGVVMRLGINRVFVSWIMVRRLISFVAAVGMRQSLDRELFNIISKA